jgi:hypothetical protein
MQSQCWKPLESSTWRRENSVFCDVTPCSLWKFSRRFGRIFGLHVLTLWSWALHESPPVAQPLDNLPAFYGTRRFITAFTRALQLPLSRSPRHPILSLQDSSEYHPPTYVLVFLVVSFPLAFLPVTYIRFSSPHSCYITHPLYSPLFNNCNYSWRAVQHSRLLVTQLSQRSQHFAFPTIFRAEKYANKEKGLKNIGRCGDGGDRFLWNVEWPHISEHGSLHNAVVWNLNPT